MSKLSKIGIERDLIVIDVLSLIMIFIVAVLHTTWLRIALGLPFILFFPGYTLIAALFPRKTNLGGIERVALSFGLSIAVAPLIGLILNYTWDIRLYPILLSLTVFILIMSAFAWYKRKRLLVPEERFFVPFLYRQHLPSLNWKGSGRADKILTIILIVSILGAIGTLAYVIAVPKVGERFTEFYVLGLDGKAAGYPTELVVGKQGNVLLGIVNQEHETASYRVEVWIDGVQVNIRQDYVVVEEIKTDLAYKEKWEHKVGFAPQHAGDNQKVEFRLFKDAGDDPYLTLHLYINVSPA